MEGCFIAMTRGNHRDKVVKSEGSMGMRFSDRKREGESSKKEIND